MQALVMLAKKKCEVLDLIQAVLFIYVGKRSCG